MRSAPPETLRALPAHAATGALRPPTPRPGSPAAQASRLPESRAAPTAGTTDGRQAHGPQSGGAGRGWAAGKSSAGGAPRAGPLVTWFTPPHPGVPPIPNQFVIVYLEVPLGPPPPLGLEGEEEARPVTDGEGTGGEDVGGGGGHSWQHLLPRSPSPTPPPASDSSFSPTWPLAGRAPPDSLAGHSSHHQRLQTAASSGRVLFPAPHVYLLLRHQRVL